MCSRGLSLDCDDVQLYADVQLCVVHVHVTQTYSCTQYMYMYMYMYMSHVHVHVHVTCAWTRLTLVVSGLGWGGA